jgi:plasmid stabilization system protein ParE
VSYRVRFTQEATQDLDRLYDFLLEKDLDLAKEAVEAIEDALAVLEKFPFSCRKAAGGSHGPFLRELIVPFGTAGYVVLFEIERGHVVTVVGVRHQRESDYY